MKKMMLVVLLLLIPKFLLITPAPAYAQTKPAATIDTIKVDNYGNVSRFLAAWYIVADSAKADTLTLPGAAQFVTVQNRGGSGDTLFVDYKGVGKQQFPERLLNGDPMITRDFGGAYVTVIYVKGKSSAVKCEVKAYK